MLEPGGEGGPVRSRVAAVPLTGMSDLVRLLAEPGVAQADAGGSFAERLGRWLDWTDAIALSAALGGPPEAAAAGVAPTAEAASDPSAAAAAGDLPALQRALRQVRTELEAAIDACGDGADAPAASAEACRRRCAAMQRLMTERLAPLRAAVRAVVARQSAALARLAALDAVMDEALAARERHLLSQVSGLLEPRLGRLRAQPGQAGAIDEALRRTLRAELALRLQPIEGLLSAIEESGRRRP